MPQDIKIYRRQLLARSGFPAPQWLLVDEKGPAVFAAAVARAGLTENV